MKQKKTFQRKRQKFVSFYMGKHRQNCVQRQKGNDAVDEDAGLCDNSLKDIYPFTKSIKPLLWLL